MLKSFSKREQSFSNVYIDIIRCKINSLGRFIGLDKAKGKKEDAIFVFSILSWKLDVI